MTSVTNLSLSTKCCAVLTWLLTISKSVLKSYFTMLTCPQLSKWWSQTSNASKSTFSGKNRKFAASSFRKASQKTKASHSWPRLKITRTLSARNSSKFSKPLMKFLRCCGRRRIIRACSSRWLSWRPNCRRCRQSQIKRLQCDGLSKY